MTEKIAQQWPLIKSNRVLIYFILIGVSGIISGILTAIVLELTDFLPNPNIKIWNMRFGGELIPFLFTLLASILWNVYRKKTSPLFNHFNFLSKRNYLLIIMSWYFFSILSFFTIGLNTGTYLTSKIPQKFTPIHNSVKRGNLYMDEKDFYYAYSENIILKVVKDRNQNWISTGLEKDAEKTEWWWDKNPQNTSLQDELSLSSIKYDQVHIEGYSFFNLTVGLILLLYIYVGWLIRDLNFILLTSPIIWWKSRYKLLGSIPLQLFNIRGNAAEFNNWIESVPPSEEDKIYIKEVISAIEKISKIKYNNAEEEAISKVIMLANLEPPFKNENLLHKIFGKIDSLRELFE